MFFLKGRRRIGTAGADDVPYSYFGTQKGDFRLELKSISARKRTDDDAERSRTRSGKVEVNSTADVNEKSKPESEGGGSMEALKDWLSALCVVS